MFVFQQDIYFSRTVHWINYLLFKYQIVESFALLTSLVGSQVSDSDTTFHLFMIKTHGQDS